VYGQRRFNILLVISGLVFLAYSSSLPNGFVYDDVYHVKETPLIRDLTNVPKMFTTSVWESSSFPTNQRYYRPLQVLSYTLNFALGGFKPFGYHLLNVLLHVANTLLVFTIVCLVSRHTFFAAAVALLFGLHPINSESVAWISGRTELLAAFFSLGSLALYIQIYPPQGSDESGTNRTRLLWGASLLAFLLGLLSKESAATMMGVLAVYEVGLRPLAPKKGLRLLPYLAVLMVYLGWRLAILGWPETDPIYFVRNPLIEETGLPRLFTGIKIFGKYLWLLFFPLRLAVDYSFNQIPVARTIWEPSVIISGTVAISLIGGWIVCWTRNRLVFFGLGFFFAAGSLIFLNSFFPFAEIMGERYMYLPSVGFVLAVAALGRLGIGILPERRRAVVAGALVATILGGGLVKTWWRNFDWRDDFSLFRSAVEINQRSVTNHFLLAVQYYDKGQVDLARSHYRKALEIYPKYAHAHLGLGSLALQEKNYPEALEHLSRSATLLPNFYQAHLFLGEAYRGLGKLDEAQKEVEIALKLNPNNPGVYNNLASILYQKGDIPRALTLWQKAVSINPFLAEGLYNLAFLYESTGQQEKARFYYQKFLTVAPERLEGLKARVRAKLSAQ
jgi:tetratricopeptide (TPR) repeat protein